MYMTSTVIVKNGINWQNYNLTILDPVITYLIMLLVVVFISAFQLLIMFYLLVTVIFTGFYCVSISHTEWVDGWDIKL